MASYSNISVALVKDEAYASSNSHTTEPSKPHICCQSLRANINIDLAGLNQDNAGCDEIRPTGLHEGRGLSSVSFNKKSNPASKALFAERCRDLMASYDTTLLECEYEIDHGSEHSDISPLLPRRPTESLRDEGQLKPPADLSGDDDQLKPPNALLGYDGNKRRPAKLLGFDGKKSLAVETLEDDGKLKSPTELLGYDGKKRCPADVLACESEKDGRTELLGSDIRDGRKNHPPLETSARVKKRNDVNSKTPGPGTTGHSRIYGVEKAKGNDVFGSYTKERSLPSHTSGTPYKSKFTRGSLEIEVKLLLMIYLS